MDKDLIVQERYLFLTGTRADFGKLKPLILSIAESDSASVSVFATGMHLQPKYGLTIKEVEALDVPVFPFVNFGHGDSMAQITSKTISGLEDYISAFPTDFLVIHGDRPEALAGAIVGIMRNIKVVHVEGGELSGTVDESVRHAVTKLSHIHLVSNDNARERVAGLGEDPSTIFKIGSPELDVMNSETLPNLRSVREKYGLSEKPHCLFVMHPVTTQNPEVLASQSSAILRQLAEIEDLQVVAISPNNDAGSESIFRVLESYSLRKQIRVIPSMRFEYYLSLLKSAEFIIGNSSSGVREAPFFGVPSINVGSRQNRRSNAKSILNVSNDDLSGLQEVIYLAQNMPRIPERIFGDGNAAKRFANLVSNHAFARAPIQKQLHSD